MRKIALMVPILILCCCGPRMPIVTLYGPPSPVRPANANIEVFSTSVPERPYIEIGEITARNRNQQINLDQIIAEARKMGADAVILKGSVGFSTAIVPVGNMAVGVSKEYGQKAVAIKWKA